ncbi:hypothetical protein B0H17DRAFT_1200667 [Mycena rosella]|uniref:Uncharacterized protein n=1 Tax=Mycena rosella TaxID=1033263 RepID=A0AAD7DK43_MYCRO|nr:hypothetical protein B0H17DRAFT_1200667 [Mycena rosella]
MSYPTVSARNSINAQFQKAATLSETVAVYVECAQVNILDADLHRASYLKAEYAFGKPQFTLAVLVALVRDLPKCYHRGSVLYELLDVFISDVTFTALAEHLQTKTHDEFTHGALVPIPFSAFVRIYYQDKTKLQSFVDTILADVFDEDINYQSRNRLLPLRLLRAGSIQMLRDSKIHRDYLLQLMTVIRCKTETLASNAIGQKRKGIKDQQRDTKRAKTSDAPPVKPKVIQHQQRAEEEYVKRKIKRESKAKKASLTYIVNELRIGLPLSDEMVLRAVTSDQTLRTLLTQAGVYHESEIPDHLPAKELKIYLGAALLLELKLGEIKDWLHHIFRPVVEELKQTPGRGDYEMNRARLAAVRITQAK